MWVGKDLLRSSYLLPQLKHHQLQHLAQENVQLDGEYSHRNIQLDGEIFHRRRLYGLTGQPALLR